MASTRVTTAYVTTGIPAARVRCCIGMGSARISTAIAVSATVSVAAAITISAVAVSTAPAPVVPRPNADEDAASEPARTVIAIGCA
jgi:hypothetical protein